MNHVCKTNWASMQRFSEKKADTSSIGIVGAVILLGVDEGAGKSESFVAVFKTSKVHQCLER